MRTLYLFLLVIALGAQTSYSQRNTGMPGDDGRLGRKDKVGEPKTDPRNPPTPKPETPPHYDYNPQPPAGDILIVQPYYPPIVFVVQPDLPPTYDPNPPPPVYTPPSTTPDPFVDYKALGKSQFNADDYFGAVESFRFALERDTSDYSLYYQLGITQIELARYEEAIHSLSRFINSVTYNSMGYYQRGMAIFYLGNKDLALEDFLIADQMNVEDVKLILKRFYNY
jgi:hypothetical protein